MHPASSRDPEIRPQHLQGPSLKGGVIGPRKGHPCPPLHLTSMKRRDKENIVTGLDFVRLLSFKLPVCVIDEGKDARATRETSLALHSI